MLKSLNYEHQSFYKCWLGRHMLDTLINLIGGSVKYQVNTRQNGKQRNLINKKTLTSTYHAKPITKQTPLWFATELNP